MIRPGIVAALLAVCAMAAGAQQVTLPLVQYESLRARANPRPEELPAPPAPFALQLADYELQADAESALVVQTLRFTVYGDQWQKVPLGEAGSFIRADFGGREGRVTAGEKDWGLEVRGRGPHQVKLESAVAVTRDETATRPTWRFALRFPAAAVVRGRIAAPQTVEEVEAEGASVVERAAAGGGWTFVALPGSEVRWTLSGKATLPRRALLPLRFETLSATASTLSRTRLQVLGWIEARVAQGRLESLRVPVPEGFDVVGVRGSYAGWTREGGTLVVTPLAPVEDSLAVEVELKGDPRDRFATPVLVPQGSARTTLLAKAALKGDGLLSLADAGTARAAEEREASRLPQLLRAAEGRLFAISDAARPPLWEAAWADRTEVLAVQIDRLVVDVAVGEAGRASYQLWAEVRNRGAQQLAITLPAGFELAAGRRDGISIVPGSAGNALAVPLLTQEATQVVHVEGVLPLAVPRGGVFEMPLPALSAPAARVEVRLVLPGGRSYALVEAARAGSLRPPPQAAARQAASELSQQVNLQVNSIARSFAPLPTGYFDCPAGFAVIGAAWSALSATPSPLAVRVEAAKERSVWF